VDAARESMARVAISLTVLALLSYTGMVISRVQRRTREAAIRMSTVDSLTDLRNRAFFSTPSIERSCAAAASGAASAC